MNRKLVHPLWVHLPSAAALVIMVVYLVTALPLASNVPVHFGGNGLPDRYGSPWEAFGIIIGLSVLFIGLSVFFDELWARQESKKNFNWLSLMDDVVVGGMTGIGLGYLFFLQEAGAAFSFPWASFWPVFGAAVVLGIILELARPYRPYRQPLAPAATAGLRGQISKRSAESTGFVYWDYQNPLYISLLTTLLPLVMFTAAAFAWRDVVWVGVLLIIVGLLLIIPHGGLRTLVTREGITVRFGLLGITLLHLRKEDIAEVRPHEFSPIKDFGGYGIRFNREMKGYFMRGTRGVLFTTTNGKKYLVGSDRANDLLAVAEGLLEG